MGKHYMKSAWELEIEDRLAKATPGPWRIEPDVPMHPKPNKDKTWVYIKPSAEVAEEKQIFAVCNIGPADDSLVQADAALIANAQADLNMLLTLVSKLRAELAAVTS